jgi:aminoglycoside phosphotransferase family enzyme
LSCIRYVEEMSDEEFKQELLSLWESMLLFDCCGFNDLFRF